MVEAAKQCEKSGYDSVWAFDHLAPYWTISGSSLECWTVLAAVAERIKTIRIGSLVTNVELRNPLMLARITSTLNLTSKGRLMVGLGTGDRLSRTELTSYGYSFRSLDKRLAQLDETIRILKTSWAREDSNFIGKHCQGAKTKNTFKPSQESPPIWIGGKHEKIINLVARSADGWNYWNLTKNESQNKIAYLRERCSRLHRPFENITRSWSGTLHSDSMNKETLLERLRNEVGHEIRYLIVSFGPQANARDYETFAEAAAQF